MNWRWGRQRKLPRRNFLLTLVLGIVSVISSLTKKAKGQQGNRASTKPPNLKIVKIAPISDFQLSPASPLFQFVDDTVPRQWWYATPVKEGQGKTLAAQITQNQTDLSILDSLNQMPTNKLLTNSWPDFTDAIDLKALGNDRPQVYSVLYTVVAFQKSRLLRVCHGTAGLNVTARIWLAGVPVEHGELIRVSKGIYPVLVEAYHGHRTQWLPWNLARLATRFTEVTEQEVEEVYQWHQELWQDSPQMTQAESAQLLAAVEIDPKTIRGQAGFFRVGQSLNGKWWLLDRAGQPFYHRGCTGLNAGGMGGRRANLPTVSQATAKQWVAFLQEWGFNAMGAWTTSEFFDLGMPFTEIIETYYEEPWLVPKFPDVWDRRWSENVDAKCKKLCTPLKNNPMLLGYFLDNERGFMEMVGHNQTIIARTPTYRSAEFIEDGLFRLPAEPKLNPSGIGLLQFSLSQNQGVPAQEKAWNFVLKRYGSLEAISQAWQVPIPSQEAIKKLTERGEILISKAYLEAQHDFVKLWVEQYYRVCTEKIRKYDPNHLLLGGRWGGTPGPAVLEIEKQWADVVSRNNYRANFYELFDDFYQQVQRPILNGEFSGWSDSFSLFRNPIEPPGGYEPYTRRAIRHTQALERIFSHPGVVGYTKYRWHGKGDKLWDNGPQMQVIEPLRRANAKAVSIATAWDRPVTDSTSPLHGQIFITLLAGAVQEQMLTPVQVGVPSSLRLSGQNVSIGLVCRHGNWDRTVYGDGIRGEILLQITEGDRIDLKLKLKQFPTFLTQLTASAQYTLNLSRNRTKLSGKFQGQYNNRSVEGRALGYVHRPVPTVRC